MKKLLTLTLTLGLSCSSTQVISCSNKIVEKYDDYNGNTESDGTYQFITGPKKGSILKNSNTSEKSIDYFFGKSSFNYASYKKENDTYIFNGNEENVKRTAVQNRDVNLIDDQKQTEQLILFKNNNTDNITDLNVSFRSDDDTKSLIDSVSVIKPIKTTTTAKGDNSHVDNGEFITFDEISNNSMQTMKYSFQPILITYKNSYNKEFKNTSSITVSYKCNGNEESFNVSKKINSKIENNSEKSNFSSGSMFYIEPNEKFILKELDNIITNKNITISSELYNKIQSNTILNDNLKSLILEKIKESNTKMTSDFTIDDNFKTEENKNIIVTVTSKQYRDNKGNHSIDVTLKNSDALKSNLLSDTIIDNDLVSIKSGTTEATLKSTNTFRVDSTNKDVNLNNKVDKTLTNLNSDINWNATDVSAMVPIIKLNNTSDSFENYLNTLFNSDNQKIEDIFNNLINEKTSITFNYDLFDREVNYFINKGNIKDILLDVINRGENSLSFYIENPDSSESAKTYYKLTIKDELIRYNTQPKGELSPAGDEYIKLYLPKAIQSISDHIKNNFTNTNFYISLDEMSNTIVSKFKNVIDKIDGTRLKLHTYAGWQFSIANNLTEEQFEEQFDSIDYMTIQIRDIIKSYESSESTKKLLINYFDHRTEKGLQTHLYSSWNDYPGGYIGSNGFELSYAPILAKSLHAKGFNRFEIEWYPNDFSLDSEVTGNAHEAGDESLLYNGDDNKFNDSLRYVNFVEGFDMVSRLNELSSINIESLITYKYTSNVSEDNIDSKWDFNSTSDDSTISGQEEIIRNKLNIL